MTAQPTNNFSFVRLVAASMVLVGHSYAINGVPGVPVFFRASISTLAVKIFFVLSGYLVTKSWLDDPSVPRYIVRRALRIMPALVCVTILSMFIVGPLFTTIELSQYLGHTALWSYLYNIVFYIHYSLPAVFAANIYPHAVNGSLWSLPAEVAMYIIVAVVGICGQAQFRWFWLASTILIIALNFWFVALGFRPVAPVVFYATDVMAWLAIAPYFMVGGCMYVFRDTAVMRPNLLFAAMAVVAGVFLARSASAVEPLLIAITSYAVISFCLSSTPLIRDFGRFGDISYGVYLYAFPIQQMIAAKLHNSIGFVQSTALALLATYAAAFFSWHLLEKQTLKLKPARSGPDEFDTQALYTWLRKFDVK
jgi:peptidoglycan/LPS O-acetylase OafA/YrhL